MKNKKRYQVIKENTGTQHLFLFENGEIIYAAESVSEGHLHNMIHALQEGACPTAEGWPPTTSLPPAELYEDIVESGNTWRVITEGTVSGSTYQEREKGRNKITRMHRRLLKYRLEEGYTMTESIKLASDDLQIAIGNRNPSAEVVNKIKKGYPSGTRVELIYMDDSYGVLEAGDKGTVDHVDAIGTIHVNWDNGSRLGVAYPVDKVVKLKSAVQELLESFAKLQEANAPKYIYPCPRCGSNNMDEKITRNALSRRANVHICSDCGTHEALLDMSGQEPLAFEEWNLFLLIDTLRTEK